MKRLLNNEFVKLKHSKSVKGVLIAFLCLGMMSVSIKGTEIIYGYKAPFLWLSTNGACGFFLYALIVAGMTASEFELGVIHNALGSGVERGKYFAAKFGAVSGVCVAIYLAGMCFFTALSTISEGFDPKGQAYSEYGLKVLVFNIGAVIAILTYVAVFLFLAYLFRYAAVTFIVSIIVTIVDLLGWFPGPMTAAWKTIDIFLKDAVLSRDFAAAFVPCICIFLLSLAGAYVLFRFRDLN